MRSSTAVGLAAARGKFTSMPRYIIGAVSMKIRSRTSTTSTSGMMLISERLVPMRRAPPGGPELNAIFCVPRQRRRRTTQVGVDVECESQHSRRQVLHPVDEDIHDVDGRMLVH